MTVTPAGSEVDYVVTYLEMTARPEIAVPHQPPGRQAALLRADAPPVWYFRSLYHAVGRDYAWEDIDLSEDAELARWLGGDGTALHSLLAEGVPQGFFLLDGTEPGRVELAYFGLVPEAVGRGWGGWLLQAAIRTAWERPGTERLTVNTCTLDHPRALALYQRHGFVPVRRETKRRRLTRDRDPARIPD